MDIRTCNICKTPKPLDQFYNNRSLPLGKTYSCKICTLAKAKAKQATPEGREYNRIKSRAWYANNPRRGWAHNLKRFSLTPDDYEAILDRQGRVCAVCKGPERTRKDGKVQRLSVDHSHTCCPENSSCGACIRGLLCVSCNNLVGMIEYDRARTQNALNYVTEHE